MKKMISGKRLREIFKEELRSVITEIDLGEVTKALRQQQSLQEPPSDEVMSALDTLKQRITDPSHLKYLEGLIAELEQSKAAGTPTETNTMMGLWDLQDQLEVAPPAYKGTFD